MLNLSSISDIGTEVILVFDVPTLLFLLCHAVHRVGGMLVMVVSNEQG